MGLEAATYIVGLTPSWPPSGDPKSQGDDHLRLIKGVLQATFPNASKPFYFPSAEVSTIALVLDATDYQNTVLIDTTSGNVNVTLPAGLVAADKGFWTDVVKTSSDANAVIVAAASGTILSKSGATATIRVGALSEPARFLWTGSGWLCFKYGAMIGTVASFDGATTPPGYLLMDGSTYSNTAFAELFAVLATTTLRDRRGRSDIGEGTGSGLTARVAGTNYGSETTVLVAANHASHQHDAFVKITDPQHGHPGSTGPSGLGAGGGTFTLAGGAFQISTALTIVNNSTGITANVASTAGGTDGKTALQGSATPFSVLQPVIGAKKVIRAC
jgi:microcystin-dependent protein